MTLNHAYLLTKFDKPQAITVPFDTVKFCPFCKSKIKMNTGICSICGMLYKKI